MPARTVRGNYAELAQIAQAFGNNADQLNNSLQRIKAAKNTLASGDWVGRGATAFYGEMDSQVLPAMQRLVNALQQAKQVTGQISGVVQQAEGDAAEVFRGVNENQTPVLGQSILASAPKSYMASSEVLSPSESYADKKESITDKIANIDSKITTLKNKIAEAEKRAAGLFENIWPSIGKPNDDDGSWWRTVSDDIEDEIKNYKGEISQLEKQKDDLVKQKNKLIEEQLQKIRSKYPDHVANLDKIKQYDAFIEEASKQYGVSVDKLKAIICVESRGNSDADSGAAKGLMQITRDTWLDTQRRYPELKDYSYDQYANDPKVNILFGTAAFVEKGKRIGLSPDHPDFVDATITAYNAGEGTVKMAMENARKDGSQNPSRDFLKPEYLKPAIEKAGIYSYYLNHGAKDVPDAINKKYNEVSKYASKVEDYLKIQEELSSVSK